MCQPSQVTSFFKPQNSIATGSSPKVRAAAARYNPPWTRWPPPVSSTLANFVSRAVLVVDHQSLVGGTNVHTVDSAGDVHQRIERVAELLFDARGPVAQAELRIVQEAAEMPHQLQPDGFRAISLRHSQTRAFFLEDLVQNSRTEQRCMGPFGERAMQNASL